MLIFIYTENQIQLWVFFVCNFKVSRRITFNFLKNSRKPTTKIYYCFSHDDFCKLYIHHNNLFTQVLLSLFMNKLEAAEFKLLVNSHSQFNLTPKSFLFAFHNIVPFEQQNNSINLLKVISLFFSLLSPKIEKYIPIHSFCKRKASPSPLLHQ